MENNYTQYIPIIKALSDDTRLKIVDMLSCGELCACKILEAFNITQPTLSSAEPPLSRMGWLRTNLIYSIKNSEFMGHLDIKEETGKIIGK